MLCYVIYFVIINLLHFFFIKITYIFSCSGMFRNVPECSVFLVLSTPIIGSITKDGSVKVIEDSEFQVHSLTCAM